MRICILERYGASGAKRVSVRHKAVVEAEPSEESGVDEPSRAEPSTMKRDGTTAAAMGSTFSLPCVGYPTGKGRGFQMPLHYPRYRKEEYEKMEEWKVDLLLQQYGLCFKGTLQEKRTFAMAYYYFSTFLFSIFTHTLQTKYMFLLCNAILAFLANSSAFHNNNNIVPEEATNTNSSLVAQEEEVEEQEDGGIISTIEASIEEEEEEEIRGGSDEDQLVNSDELNRKFEEFIRKMKEEIKIEAQRPLIEV
ncbi:hypothetical protein G2W53_002823 [Senna tora]|uniref:DUF7722 domain-containing protein n=1 Tax=Senna tora TaxID=362788 RepID=A0A835CHW2_9FABA|nr:hypothetical protein G2W53_002823 [Senna tora]